MAKTELTAPAAIELERVVEQAGEAAVFRLVEAGMTLNGICEHLGLVGTGASREQARQALIRWLNKRPEDYEEAKRISALALVEQGGAILDNEGKPPETAAEARWLSDRAGWRRWLAETRDPDQFSKSADVEVNMTLGEAHLQALIKHGSMPRHDDDVEAIEAEIIEDDSGKRAKGGE